LNFNVEKCHCPAQEEFFHLLQLRILRFRFFQNWDAGVGVFREEILVGGGRADVGRIRSCALAKVPRSKRSHEPLLDAPTLPSSNPKRPAVVESHLKLLGGGVSLSSRQVCLFCSSRAKVAVRIFTSQIPSWLLPGRQTW